MRNISIVIWTDAVVTNNILVYYLVVNRSIDELCNIKYNIYCYRLNTFDRDIFDLYILKYLQSV